MAYPLLKRPRVPQDRLIETVLISIFSAVVALMFCLAVVAQYYPSE